MTIGIPPEAEHVFRDLFGPEAVGVSPAGQSLANQVMAPNEPDDQQQTPPMSQVRDLMAALYGSTFPLIAALETLDAQARANDPNGVGLTDMPPLETLLPETTPDDWCSWVRNRWSSHNAAVEYHLHLIARNRLFRNDFQWVSSKGRSPWREPPRPTETARVTDNKIGPALDQRCQIISDQRPGFDVEPTALTPDEKRKAEGRQQALEYHYDAQSMDRQCRTAAYWSQTDGVAFWHTYWDPEAGPWDPRMDPTGRGRHVPMGDLRTQTVRCEQVRVSANATADQAPYYVILRDVIPETEAAYRYGKAAIQSSADSSIDTDTSSTQDTTGMMPSYVLQQTIVGEGSRMRNVKVVERLTMYVDRHPDILPDGLQLVCVGNAVVWGPGELLFGVIPVVRFADGSTDPSYFCRPIMEQWIPCQMRINAAKSMLVNSARVNSGGRIAGKPDAIVRETFIGSGLSFLEVNGPGEISQNIMPIAGFSAGDDIEKIIELDTKAFEDMSGYNDVSRGQVSDETATAVATANEQLARVFSPPCEAAARAFEDWAKIQVAGMAWGYDLPRDMGSVGANRPDLARALSAEDFQGPCSVHVDPAKLIPMPKLYRQARLDQMYQMGLIDAQQYKRLDQFGNITKIESPDEDQYNRAKRVADALRMGLPPEQIPPIRWQDNEAIHQDVLERDILLQDDLDPSIIDAANQRWMQLANQASQKQGAMQPQASPMSHSGGHPPFGGQQSQSQQQQSPSQQPMDSSLPPSTDQMALNQPLAA